MNHARLFLTTGFLLFAIVLPAHAAVNGFEGGDGDQACAGGADWACLPAGVPLRTAADATGAGDVVFAGGKETEPASWTFGSGATGDKTDVRSIWSAAAETPSDSFLYLAFDR